MENAEAKTANPNIDYIPKHQCGVKKPVIKAPTKPPITADIDIICHEKACSCYDPLLGSLRD